MTTNFANKTSSKVAFQLPEFIRSDTNYQTFVAFIQAYYEWLEQQNIGSGKEGVIYGTQNLLNYQNLDFVEPPHMQVSMLWSDDMSIAVGDNLNCNVRNTTTSFDCVTGLD
jgi:hypothetical protein